MMSYKAKDKILVLKYLLCNNHISILITWSYLEQMYKNDKTTILVIYILLSCSYLVENWVHKWEELEYIII